MAVQETATPTPAAYDTGEGLLELFPCYSGRWTCLVATQGDFRDAHPSRRPPSQRRLVPAALSRLRSVTSDRAGDWLQVMADYTPTTIRGVFLRIRPRYTTHTIFCRLVSTDMSRFDIVQTVGRYLDGSDQSVLATIQTIVLVMLAFVLSDQMQRWFGRLSHALGFTEHL